jgi:hypothetical protein
MEKYIRYKGKGEHSVNELEKIIEQREEELHLIRSNQVVLPQANVIKSVCEHKRTKYSEFCNGDMCCDCGQPL